MTKRTLADQMEICVSDTREDMGRETAKDFAACMQQLLAKQPLVRIVFAAAPSQNDFLRAIAEDQSINFGRVDAFHMDEYIGLDEDAPQGFGNFLDRAIFKQRSFHSVSYLKTKGDPETTCREYAQKLAEQPIDIVCMGIGENGHIAFNDPHVADFNDPEAVKIVRLDDVCRAQQVHDGCFATLDDVPIHALTLTIPTLASARYHFCVVPTLLKAEAVKRTVKGEISASCPASILRTLPGSVLYLDAESASLL